MCPKAGGENAAWENEGHFPKKYKTEPKGKDMSKVKCFKCKAYGHYIADCPQKS